MNYRHAYHAGNFADVVKHAILALCVDYLKQKPGPFRVIDTHAGIGLYDLAGIEAGKTLEWTHGIGRLLDADAPPPPEDVAAALSPYLGVIHEMNPSGAPSRYPGSPLLVRKLLRPGDVLAANELHPADHATLAALFAGDAAVRIMNIDAWAATKALLPPKERRGLVLIDPPFEARDEFEKLAQGLADARRRFATGALLLWHPVKGPEAVRDFYAAARPLAGDKALRVELTIRAPVDETRLNGCGLLIVNPPWTLAERLRALLPFLAERLAQGRGGSWRVDAL